MKRQSEVTLFANARVVLADRVIPCGWVAARDGLIEEVGEGVPPEAELDCEGDLLLPGLIELHTDHLEAHCMPRPNVRWDPLAAVIAYDAQLATAGITTVLDSLRLGREEAETDEARITIEPMSVADAIAIARTAALLRADHYLHLRCEVPMPTVVNEAAQLVRRPDVRLLSLMDHTPGQRQFRSDEKLRAYYRGKYSEMCDCELSRMFARRIAYQRAFAADNFARLATLAGEAGVPLASHDDTEPGHVAEAIAAGVVIAEFPTTFEAARALHEAGVKVLMGAPNVVRGGSHSGNVAAAELAKAGMLDAMSSDYVPGSLLMATLTLPEKVRQIDVPTAVRMVTKTPAEAVGLDDRGEIAPNKRADLIQVRTTGAVPAVRAVWRAGQRVA